MQKNSENTGPKFDADQFNKARELTWAALEKFQSQIHPGMQESEGRKLLEGILTEMGTTKRWHKTHVRFGPNTLKSFSEQSEEDPILKENDIFFADIGPIFNEHEGDCGNTWIVGNDAKMKECAQSVKEIFELVSSHWKNTSLSGTELYRFAESVTEEKGWRLSTSKAPGHRLSDFPHQIHHKGNLADFESAPSAGLWILEIQIEHPDGLYGAFYEDLLV